ncbi:MAG: endonuclease/exonuclease/phosphatase family protein [Roseibacillus sp.]
MTSVRNCILSLLAVSSALTHPLVAVEEVLVGWHEFDASNRHRFLNSAKDAFSDFNRISGKLYGGNGSRSGWSSTDGQYGGSVSVGPIVTDGSMSMRTDSGALFFLLENGSTGSVTLSRILFDFASINNNSPRNLHLYYDQGDLAVGNNTLIESWLSIHNGLGLLSDYEDVEVDLSGLADRVLGPGQTARFRLQVDTASNPTQALGIDNLAITGETTDFRILTYNIHGGKGPNGEGDLVSNITAFRETLMQNEDVLCLQEVDVGANWTTLKGLFPDYPYTIQTVNTTTGFIWPWESQQQTSIAILSKYPFTQTHEQLIQIDPGGDRWERYAHHVTIEAGGVPYDIFHYHNTYNFNDDDFASEKAGMVKFRDYALNRMSLNSLSEGRRMVLLGDYNIFQDDVVEIVPTRARRSNGRDHITGQDFFASSGVYQSGLLSDHNVVWAFMDVAPPVPVTAEWAVVPAAESESMAVMTAQTAYDPRGVEYYFSNLSVPDGSHDSGWQTSAFYRDTGLQPATSYQYAVMTRDQSGNQNEGLAATSFAVVTEDGDAVPDAWEMQYFGNVTETQGATGQDWDGDGSDDYSEWIAGTDPTDASSYLQAWMEAGGSAGVVDLCWNGLAGKSYQVLTSSSLETPVSEWTVVVSDSEAELTEHRYEITVASGAQFFCVAVSL